eukprot:g13338.t1
MGSTAFLDGLLAETAREMGVSHNYTDNGTGVQQVQPKPVQDDVVAFCAEHDYGQEAVEALLSLPDGVLEVVKTSGIYSWLQMMQKDKESDSSHDLSMPQDGAPISCSASSTTADEGSGSDGNESSCEKGTSDGRPSTSSAGQKGKLQSSPKPKASTSRKLDRTSQFLRLVLTPLQDPMGVFLENCDSARFVRDVLSKTEGVSEAVCERFAQAEPVKRAYIQWKWAHEDMVDRIEGTQHCDDVNLAALNA